jgi:ABC-type branched-subunit amino acid transport system permease subunit
MLLLRGYLALLFLAGLVLPSWWLVSASPRGVPGLGAYPSAYIGDTVLLPAACLLLAIGIGKLPPARRERTFAAFGAAVAAVTAIVAQADWLYDPTTQPDWTMPRTGHFDAAGWWHAAYFTAMTVTLVVLIAVFLARARAGRLAGSAAVAEISSGMGAALLLTALGAYAALAIHDDLAGPPGRSAVSSLVLDGLALALIALLAGAAYGRRARVLQRPALLALGGIAAIVLTTTPAVTWLPAGIPAAAVCCTISAAAGRRKPSRPHRRR